MVEDSPFEIHIWLADIKQVVAWLVVIILRVNKYMGSYLLQNMLRILEINQRIYELVQA